MESNPESNVMDMLFNILIAIAVYLVTVEIIFPMLFPKKKGCGCNKGGDFALEPPVADFDDSDFSPKDKACLAVGSCTANVPVPKVALWVWQEKIVNNAEKIFGKIKDDSKKKPAKKHKSNKRR